MKKILPSEITPYSQYLNRRKFIKSTSIFSLVSLLNLPAKALHNKETLKYNKLLSEGDNLNTYEEITTYNNFYEFGAGKSDPSSNSELFIAKPWKLKIEGLVEKPFEIGLEDLLKKVNIEARVYSLRCVEAWSMVIPWQGFPLSQLIEIASPLSSAKFLQFETVFRPAEMPGQRRNILPWPYVEGLTIEEATNELAFIATGIYGKQMPGQHGAPPGRHPLGSLRDPRGRVAVPGVPRRRHVRRRERRVLRGRRAEPVPRRACALHPRH